MNGHEQSKCFDAVVGRLKSIMESKGDDYANDDRLSNFKLAGAICGMSAERNCLSLIATKVARLGVLLDGDSPNNESADDSIIDLAMYAILLYMLKNDNER